MFDQIHLFTAGVHMSVIGLHVMCCTAKIRKEWSHQELLPTMSSFDMLKFDVWLLEGVLNPSCQELGGGLGWEYSDMFEVSGPVC